MTFSGCKRLEKLDVSSNQIQYCDVLKEMGFLKVLNLRTNSIEEFPEADLEELVKLDLSKNKLSAFPRNLKAMKSLKKLEMAHNQINVIPSELGNGQLLEEIDLSWNNLGLVSQISSQIGVGDGFWRRYMLMTTFRCFQVTVLANIEIQSQIYINRHQLLVTKITMSPTSPLP